MRPIDLKHEVHRYASLPRARGQGTGMACPK